MWIVVCVRCLMVHSHRTRTTARGHAEAHSLAHGCADHTFFWKQGATGPRLGLHRPGGARRKQIPGSKAA
jgi:hypothetical protein